MDKCSLTGILGLIPALHLDPPTTAAAAATLSLSLSLSLFLSQVTLTVFESTVAAASSTTQSVLLNGGNAVARAAITRENIRWWSGRWSFEVGENQATMLDVPWK